MRISCAPMPSTKSSASARQLDAPVSAVDRRSYPYAPCDPPEERTREGARRAPSPPNHHDEPLPRRAGGRRRPEGDDSAPQRPSPKAMTCLCALSCREWTRGSLFPAPGAHARGRLRAPSRPNLRDGSRARREGERWYPEDDDSAPPRRVRGRRRPMRAFHAESRRTGQTRLE